MWKMFLRFVTSEVDDDSQVAAGVFVLACKLRDEGNLPDYEHDHLKHIIQWFNENLERPRKFSRSSHPHPKNKAVSWFRSTAACHLEKIREMIVILENNGVHVHMVKTQRPGYIVYEDEHQVVAEPYADVRF